MKVYFGFTVAGDRSSVGIARKIVENEVARITKQETEASDQKEEADAHQDEIATTMTVAHHVGGQ